jgi:iron complex transport system ATP-binding protein
MPSPDMPDRLAAEAIAFSRGARCVLSGASLAFERGELVALLGANGAGKTTLLRIMLGLLAPAAGKVTLGGEPLQAIGRRQIAQRLAYVPQSHHAPFPYRVWEVVAMGRTAADGLFRGMDARGEAKVEEALAALRIAHLAERAYTRLSGGERQLVMIARAMAQGACLLVMDEPLAGLDYGHQIRLLRRLRELAGNGYGVLFTTHDPGAALGVSTRAATLCGGRIDADGAPREVITPGAIRRIYGEDAGEDGGGWLEAIAPG